MSTTRAAAVLATATVAVATLLTTSSASPPTAAPTNPDPRLFKHPQDNPFFLLTPGLVTRLRGADGDERFKQTVRVTTRTKVVAGVTTTVVRDVVRRLDGTLAEKTVDWYAADDDGNVWYFGEDTATYDENGTLEDRELVGSRAGRCRRRDRHAGGSKPPATNWARNGPRNGLSPGSRTRGQSRRARGGS